MNPDLAWAAGLFEGEGCFSTFQRPSGKLQVQLTLTMTDRDVVERFAAVMGVGAIHERTPKRQPRKQTYTWCVFEAAQVDALISLLLPWLGDRRRAKALEVQAASRSVQPHNREKTHCPKGHELVGDNLKLERVYRGGKIYTGRRCATCHRESSRVRYLRAKEVA